MTLNELRQRAADDLHLRQVVAARAGCPAEPRADTFEDLAIRLMEVGATFLSGAPFNLDALVAEQTGDAADAARSVMLQRWAFLGFPTFRLTHGLAASLLLTSTEVPMAQLRLPYDAFVIELPGPEPLISIPSPPPASSLLPCLRIGIMEQRRLTVPSSLVDVQTEILHAINADAASVPEALLNILRGVEAARRSAPLDSTGLVIGLQSASSWLQTANELPAPGADLEAWIAEFRGREGDGVTNCGVAAARLAVNLGLYLSRRDDGTAQDAAARLGKPLRQTPVKVGAQVVTPKTWLVGQEIKLPHEFYTAAAAAVKENARAPWKVKHRFMVRGHQRLQACGTRWKDHKLIWVKPFWKGPADAHEALTRTYAVHAKDEPAAPTEAE